MIPLSLAWLNLLSFFKIESKVAQQAFLEIVKAHASPGRHYHTLEHVWQVLQTIDGLQEHTHNLEAVRLAAWFHDSVYDPQSTDNEERSSDYAQELLTSLGIPTSIVAEVSQLILATKHHFAEPDDRDSQVLLDADLGILGSTPEQYQAYAQAIRQEYHWVPEPQYRAARKQVLSQFLQRERIYYTPTMFQGAEAIARENLQREIESLS